jgi:LPS O-antigen subunit length determinant protein (WzzB/FepE family)
MNTARKIMNNQKIEITEEGRKAALAKFMATPVSNMDDVLDDYINTLNQYCEHFNAKSHDELMARADELEFEAKICSDILDKFSFIQRNKIQ